MRNGLRTTALLLAAGFVVFAAGCGSSTAAAPTTTHTVPASGPGPTGSTGPTGATGDFASAKNCLDFAHLASQIASGKNPAGASSPQAGASGLQALADAAPSDIKPDLQTIATTFSSYLQAVQNSGYKFGSTTPPTSAQFAAMGNSAKAFSSSQFRQAETNLKAWALANCK